MHTHLKFKFKILIPIPTWNQEIQDRKYNLERRKKSRYHLPLHCPCPFTSPFSIVTLKIQIKFRLDNTKNHIAFGVCMYTPCHIQCMYKRKFLSVPAFLLKLCSGYSGFTLHQFFFFFFFFLNKMKIEFCKKKFFPTLCRFQTATYMFTSPFIVVASKLKKQILLMQKISLELHEISTAQPYTTYLC